MTPVVAALRHVLRRPGRVLLAVAGVALGAAVYVLLLTIGDGVVREIRRTSNLTGAELVLQQRGAGFPELSWIGDDEAAAIAATPGVAATLEVAIRVTRFAPSVYLLVLGVGPDIPLLPGMALVAGRLPAPGGDEILLGRAAAATLGVAAGDPLRLQDRELRVSGVFSSDHSLLERGAALPLALHQRLFDIGGRRNLVFVHLAAGATESAVTAALERRLPDLAVVPTDGLTAVYGQVDVVGQFARVLGLAAALLTLLAVANVQLVSVADRLAELALLRAVGWGRGRVLAMVLAEGALVAAAGIAVGIGLAAVTLPLVAAGDVFGIVASGLAPARCLEAAAVTATACLLGTLPAALYGLTAREASLLRG